MSCMSSPPCSDASPYPHTFIDIVTSVRLVSGGSSIAATFPTSAVGTSKYVLVPTVPLTVRLKVVPSGSIPTGVQLSLLTALARLAELTRTAVGLNAGCWQRSSIEPGPLIAPEGVLDE